MFERLCQDEPGSHWMLAKLACAMKLADDYTGAARAARRGLKLCDTCPLLLWELASSLEGGGKYRKAIEVYHELLGMGIKKVAFGSCPEGLRWGKSLLNDSRYFMALCYEEIGERDTAVRWYRKHLKNRQAGIPAQRTKRHVEKRLQSCINGEPIP